MIFDDTFNHEVWNDTDETRVVLFVDVLRPLPSPESLINRADRQGDRLLAVRARREAQPGGVGTALPGAPRACERAAAAARRAVAGTAAQRPGVGARPAARDSRRARDQRTLGARRVFGRERPRPIRAQHARDVQPGALQQRVRLSVEHRELAGQDQQPEGDHHGAADGDDHREVALDDGQRVRSCARRRARSAGTGSRGRRSRRRAAARRGRPSSRSPPA